MLERLALLAARLNTLAAWRPLPRRIVETWGKQTPVSDCFQALPMRVVYYSFIYHIIPSSCWIKMHWICVVLIVFHDWYTEGIRGSWLSTGGKDFSLAWSFFSNTANGCCCCCHFCLFLCQDVPPAYQWPSVCYHMFPPRWKIPFQFHTLLASNSWWR